MKRINEIEEESHKWNVALDSSRKMISNRRPISNVEDVGFMTEYEMALAYKKKLEEYQSLTKKEMEEFVEWDYKF